MTFQLVAINILITILRGPVGAYLVDFVGESVKNLMDMEMSGADKKKSVIEGVSRFSTLLGKELSSVLSRRINLLIELFVEKYNIEGEKSTE